MNAKEIICETEISDARWWAYDIPGNAGWIAYLVCLVKNLKRGLNTFNMTALLPGGLMLLGIDAAGRWGTDQRAHRRA